MQDGQKSSCGELQQYQLGPSAFKVSLITCYFIPRQIEGLECVVSCQTIVACCLLLTFEAYLFSGDLSQGKSGAGEEKHRF